MTITERMKKYAELDAAVDLKSEFEVFIRGMGIFDLRRIEDIKLGYIAGCYAQIEPNLQALEVAREALINSKVCARWIMLNDPQSKSAKEIFEQVTKTIKDINQILGEK